MNDIESLIPAGWLLYSADFSLKAAGKLGVGYVMLSRDRIGFEQWFHLRSHSDEPDTFKLYAHGSGATLREAVENAVKNIQLDEMK